MVNFVEYGFLCDVISLDIKIQRRANIIFENKTPLIYINNVLAIPYSSNLLLYSIEIKIQLIDDYFFVEMKFETSLNKNNL